MKIIYSQIFVNVIKDFLRFFSTNINAIKEIIAIKKPNQNYRICKSNDLILHLEHQIRGTIVNINSTAPWPSIFPCTVLWPLGSIFTSIK